MEKASTNAKGKLAKTQDLKLLYLSFYNLDYGIGASAAVIDQLNDLPIHVSATVIEPNRTDLPRVKVELSIAVQRVKISLPLKGSLSLLYPFLAFFYGLKIAKNLKPDLVFSMHHPHHTLSLTGHIISKILNIPHVVDLHDVLRPMGQKPTTSFYLKDILERVVAKLIHNDHMVFMCSENKKLLETRAKTNFNNALILPNCVSHCLIESTQIKKTRTGKKIQFIFVGRVGREYGLSKIQPLLDALPSFGYDPHLLVVGHNQVGVPKSAKYVGSLPRKKTIQLIAESDVGVGPLYPTISVPLKVVEYLALGKIIIVGKNAVSEDILKEYGEFFLEISETDNVNQVIQRMLTMLRNVNYNPEKVANLFCQRRMEIILERVLSVKLNAVAICEKRKK